MSTRQRTAPSSNFPTPSERYDAQNEAHFRAAVEQAIQAAAESILKPHMVTDDSLLGTENDYDLGQFVTVVRVDTTAGAVTITGVANGYDARSVRFINVGANTFSFEHENAGSIAAHRIMLTGGTKVNLSTDEMIDLQYDPVTARWRETNTT